MTPNTAFIRMVVSVLVGTLLTAALVFISAGVRVGNIVYETKIPFLTRQYLAESDPTLKRYYYCHCPWAREAVKSGEKVTPIFCNCSAGFHEKPWEGALGQKIHVEVLESVLKGDARCRFAIHLPEDVK